MTIYDLYMLCKKEIDLGNEDKKILISDDVEGNGFHKLIYEFDYDKEEIEKALFKYLHTNPDDYVLLG